MAEMDAIVCTLPQHVLLLSGYWPVVGTALAIAARGAGTLLIVPDDERELAERSWADACVTFHPGQLEHLTTAAAAVGEPLAAAVRTLGLERGRLGYEGGPGYTPASYAAMHLYGAGIVPVLEQALPGATLVAADAMLARLCAVKTPREVACIRTACRLAARAFGRGAAHLRAGIRETEAAAQFRLPLGTREPGEEGIACADGFLFCMSGANAAQASGAYARSRAKALAPQELVLVHGNTYADGYWTDITRTYCLGEPDARQRALYAAVFEARQVALQTIRPGVAAAAVDRAARAVLTAHGFGPCFPHGTGHGVGFAAINHNARPRLHPRSDDTLECGMVFNVEPAIYIEGYGGVRHCDVVALTEQGVEVLTPLQSALEHLCLSSDPVPLEEGVTYG
jgi:Xaa-Pro aminopeptidase